MKIISCFFNHLGCLSVIHNFHMPVTQEGICPAVKWAYDAVVVEFVKQLFVGGQYQMLWKIPT